MIGRAAYQDPAAILLDADRVIFDEPPSFSTPEDAVLAMRPYIETVLSDGHKLSAVTRHMLGLFNGRPGARAWRRVLSEHANRPDAGWHNVEEALASLEVRAA